MSEELEIKKKSHKERLQEIFDELAGLDTDDLSEKIEKIKEELKVMIEEAEEASNVSDEAVMNEIIESRKDDKMLGEHHRKRAWQVIKEAKDETKFTPKDIIFIISVLAILILSIVILAVVL